MPIEAGKLGSNLRRKIKENKIEFGNDDDGDHHDEYGKLDDDGDHDDKDGNPMDAGR